MRSCVRRMSLIADERNRSVRLTVREGEIEVTAQSSEEGEGSEVVQADYKGDEIQLGFNWQYLFEFLNNAATGDLEATAEGTDAAASDDKVKETDGDKVRVRAGSTPLRVRFEFKDPNAQTQMSIDGETTYDYKYIVMPLRI